MTMHNHAEVGEISERIVLVGDPNRAKYIAEHYLEDAVLVNDVRCAYCYTGMFNGHFSPVADFGLLNTAKRIADEEHLVTYVGGTVCNDRLYRDENYKSKMWKKYGMLCSEQEGCAFYTAAAEFGCRALMMVGITTGIRYDENGQEIFVDLPEREHAQSMDDLVRLALKTAAHAE